MKKTVYVLRHKLLKEYGMFNYDRGHGCSTDFLHCTPDIDKANLFDSLEEAEKRFTECVIWSTNPNKKDWEIIQVGIIYNIYDQ